MVIDNIDAVRAEVTRLRKERGWSRHQLAIKAGVALNTIYLLETGQNDVYLNTLVRVFGVLGMELEIEEVPQPKKRETWRY